MSNRSFFQYKKEEFVPRACEQLFIRLKDGTALKNPANNTDSYLECGNLFLEVKKKNGYLSIKQPAMTTERFTAILEKK